NDHGLEELLNELDRGATTGDCRSGSDLRRALSSLGQFPELSVPLCSFHFHSRLNRLETLIAVWFVGLVVEEAIECRNCKSPLIYLGDMWNVMDLASIGLFYLRLLCQAGTRPHHRTRRWSLRLPVFLLLLPPPVLRRHLQGIGPKIRMICEMLVTDLLPFLLVLRHLHGAFGVSLQSLLYPNGYYQRRSAPAAKGNET
uniref:Ion_trans domain-containing protein n=1 Tax=Macrostomum lignano TaxID=282301 RepID=A0A1I8FBA2_9PLAT